jgi:hypothetical protein
MVGLFIRVYIPATQNWYYTMLSFVCVLVFLRDASAFSCCIQSAAFELCT